MKPLPQRRLKGLPRRADFRPEVWEAIRLLNPRPDRIIPVGLMMEATLKSGRAVFILQSRELGLTWTNDSYCANQHLAFRHGTIAKVIRPGGPR